MPNTYTFTTDDPSLYQKILLLALGGQAPAMSAPAMQAALPGQGPAAPPAAPMQAPLAAPPAAPVAPVQQAPLPQAPPPPVQQPQQPAEPHGPAPEGWTVQHVMSALQALGANPAKGGPAKVKEILTRFGAAKVGDLNPARWPEVYQAATEG